MKHILLCVFLALLASCQTLTPEQQAAFSRMSSENTAAAQRIQALATDLEQARKDYGAGRLTQEQLNGLVLKGQEETARLSALIQANIAQAKEMQAKGVPIGQSVWEQFGPLLTQLGIAAAAAVAAKKSAENSVRQERGPIEARRGLPPKAA